MIIQRVPIELAFKQIVMLVNAAECKIAAFEDEVARIERETGEYPDDDIAGWDGNDIAILRDTAEQLRKVLATTWEPGYR